jgi:mono/diheme cytochrome c family protein
LNGKTCYKRNNFAIFSAAGRATGAAAAGGLPVSKRTTAAYNGEVETVSAQDLPETSSGRNRVRVVAAVVMVVFVASKAFGAEATAAPVTFNKDIAPIVFEHCASCHRPGEVAPFPLLTYKEARKHASEIADLTQSRQMPPWKAVDGFGEFVGKRRLGDDEIRLIQEWVKQGKPEGEAKDSRRRAATSTAALSSQ